MTAQKEDGAVSIATVASHLGLTLRSLRFYESLGLIGPFQGTYARTCQYEDQNRLKCIIKGKKLGFTLSEIGRAIGYVDVRKGRSNSELPTNNFTDLLCREAIEGQIKKLERLRAEMTASLDELVGAMSAAEPKNETFNDAGWRRECRLEHAGKLCEGS